PLAFALPVRLARPVEGHEADEREVVVAFAEGPPVAAVVGELQAPAEPLRVMVRLPSQVGVQVLRPRAADPVRGVRLVADPVPAKKGEVLEMDRRKADRHPPPPPAGRPDGGGTAMACSAAVTLAITSGGAVNSRAQISGDQSSSIVTL